jgi:ParB-like nuclease family protein
MSNNIEVANLSPTDIKADQGCQARVTTDATTIDHYAEIITEEGYVFPPVVVYYDDANYWLSDGFHRHAAAKKAGLGSLKAEIRKGSRRDAILYAVGANATLRRTREDKRHAVEILLKDEEWSKWSNRTIAHRCGVNEKLVRTLRFSSAAKPQIARRVERNGKTYDMNTNKIGKKDDLDEVLAIEPHRDVQPDQTWLVRPETVTAERDKAIDGDERRPVSDPTSGTEEVQLQELMSAWARASEVVQQQFLARISVSLAPQVEAETGLPEPEPSLQAPTTISWEPVQEPKQSTSEVPQNRLFKMWSRYKRLPRADALRWVEAGCASEYQDTNSGVTNRLVAFRAAANSTTEQERQQFVELARAF